LNKYKNDIFNNQIAIQKYNFTWDKTKSMDNQNKFYNYNTTIIESEKMNRSLELVENEYLNLDEVWSKKINMKFGMEVSILVISTLLTILGLIGNYYFSKK
jgi:hypothetical protein